jgi:hypothetical protein
MRCSEQSPWWLALIVLAVAVQPVYARMVLDAIGAAPDCVEKTMIRQAPMENGYQRFGYKAVKRCYGGQP